jgi:hypothetical protein
MAIGRAAGLFLMNQAARLAAGQKDAVANELRAAHVHINVYGRGKALRKAPSLKGHEVKALFDVWPNLVGFLGIAGSHADASMQHMGRLLVTLYRTRYDVNPAPWVLN